MSPEGAVLAHGIAVRQDLPVPYSYALVGAGLTLAVSFILLGTLWKRPRLEDRSGGRTIPAGLARLLDGSGFRWTLRVIGLLGTAFVISTAVFGPDEARNPTAGAVYVLFWIGILVVASVLLGPVWRALNPVRTLHLLLCRAIGSDPREGAFRYPAWLGAWPATFALLSFGWLELVAPSRSSTTVILTYIVLYGAIMLVGATVFGSRFLDQADGLERYSTVLGNLSVLGRRTGDRAIVLRNPLTNLTAMRTGTGAPAFVSAMLAITAYDAVSNSPTWIRWSQQGDLSPELFGTIGLFGMTAFVLVTYGTACALAGRWGGRPAHRMPAAFAHTLVPIALGYVVAHYYSFVILGTQQTVQNFSDPYGTGADYLGVGDRELAYTTITPTTIAVIQVVAVVIGHVLGVIAAHDRAVALFPRARALAGQLPLLIVMICYTVGGLTLLFAE